MRMRTTGLLLISALLFVPSQAAYAASGDAVNAQSLFENGAAVWFTRSAFVSNFSAGYGNDSNAFRAPSNSRLQQYFAVIVKRISTMMTASIDSTIVRVSQSDISNWVLVRSSN